jgi:hypothetical protein
MTKSWSFVFVRDCTNMNGYYIVRCTASTDYHTVGGTYILSYDE